MDAACTTTRSRTSDHRTRMRVRSDAGTPSLSSAPRMRAQPRRRARAAATCQSTRRGCRSPVATPRSATARTSIFRTGGRNRAATRIRPRRHQPSPAPNAAVAAAVARLTEAVRLGHCRIGASPRTIPYLRGRPANDEGRHLRWRAMALSQLLRLLSSRAGFDRSALVSWRCGANANDRLGGGQRKGREYHPRPLGVGGGGGN